MNTRALLKSIREKSRAIEYHQQQFAQSAHCLHETIIPPEPYVYVLPVLAFVLGLRYAKSYAKWVSLPFLRQYGMLFLPLLKD